MLMPHLCTMSVVVVGAVVWPLPLHLHAQPLGVGGLPLRGSELLSSAMCPLLPACGHARWCPVCTLRAPTPPTYKI